MALATVPESAPEKVVAVIVPATRFAAAYPVALVFTVVLGTVCVSAKSRNVLSVDAS